MARPFKPTFTTAEIEELRRYAMGAKLEVAWEGEKKKILTAERDHLNVLVGAERLVLEHNHWQKPPGFRVVSVPDSQWATVEPDEDFQQLAYAWKHIHGVIGEFGYPTNTATPSKCLGVRLNAFYQAYEPLMTGYQHELIASKAMRNDEIYDLEYRLKQGFEDYQHTLQSQQTARAIEQAKINANRNRRSLTHYVEALFDVYPSLYVVHLDLGYHVFARANILKASYTRLREDLRTLFYARHRNPLWKDDLVGHIWKIEDAPQRRFHAHLLLFYKGSTAEQHQEDVTHLQNRWIREITHQEGACFARLNLEGEPPVWVPENTGYLIEKEDTETLGELTSYLHYLIKVDQLFGLEAGPKSYVFAKGNTPRRPAGDTP